MKYISKISLFLTESELTDSIYFKHNEAGNDIIKRGKYTIYAKDKEIGFFGIQNIGNVNIDLFMEFNIIKKTHPNSIWISGGFVIKNNMQKKGIGTEVIKQIFKKDKKIKSIFLYALEDQNAVGFWSKLGGKIIMGKNGFYLIQLNRNNIK